MKEQQLGTLGHYVDQWRTSTASSSDVVAADAQCSVSVVDILSQMLHAAIRIEFATIPPYLCALWSIKDELHPMAVSLREIVQEEMLHMAFACNMLAAIGEEVPIRRLAPRYPSELPGDVHPGLIVELQGLNKKSLEAFLRIESPVALAETVLQEDGDPAAAGSRTIGEFYECLAAGFARYAEGGGDFHVDRQVSASLVWRVIASVKDVRTAIGIITTQGEGSTRRSSPQDSGKDDYAHYYRFLEMWKEKRLVRVEGRRGEVYEWRPGYSMPKCRPMGPVPEGGFHDPAPPVRQLLYDFDRAYHRMLELLEATWTPGGQGKLIQAIAQMFELEKYAKPLMEISRPDSVGPDGDAWTYGPTFTPPAEQQPS